MLSNMVNYEKVTQDNAQEILDVKVIDTWQMRTGCVWHNLVL